MSSSLNTPERHPEACDGGPGPSAPGGGRGRQPPAVANLQGALRPTAATATSQPEPSPRAPSPANLTPAEGAYVSPPDLPESEQFDDVTAVETTPGSPSEDGAGPARDVQLFDFKDGSTTTAVSHGPRDPSRIWLSLRTDTTIVSLSIEEGIAQQIATGLADVLRNFKAVRFGTD